MANTVVKEPEVKSSSIKSGVKISRPESSGQPVAQPPQAPEVRLSPVFPVMLAASLVFAGSAVFISVFLT